MIVHTTGPLSKYTSLQTGKTIHLQAGNIQKMPIARILLEVHRHMYCVHILIDDKYIYTYMNVFFRVETMK
jgi:hypothetical protein